MARHIVDLVSQMSYVIVCCQQDTLSIRHIRGVKSIYAVSKTHC